MASRTYNMVAVLSAGTIERKVRGAPTDAKMIEFGKKHGARAVIRFYPKYGQFVILDIRKAFTIEMAGVGKVWRGHTKAMTTFDTEAAAVMAAIHLLH